MLYTGVCTTSHLQTSGRVVQELCVFTVPSPTLSDVDTGESVIEYRETVHAELIINSSKLFL